MFSDQSVAVQAVDWHDDSGQLFWHERAAFQWSAFGQSTAGNDVVATIFIRIFGVSVRRSSGRRSGGRLLAMT